MKILIADDHAMLRELLCEALNISFGSGTEIGQVADYTALISKSHGMHSPDLILLDLNMPGRTGEIGIAEVISAYPAAKILVMSGLADPQTARRIIALGAAGFIPKTVSHKSLANAIRVIADGEKYIHSFTMSQETSAEAVEITTGRSAVFSSRESEILDCLIQGKSNKEIARHLDIQEMTIKTHLRNIYRKLGAQNRADAVSKVLRSQPRN